MTYTHPWVCGNNNVGYLCVLNEFIHIFTLLLLLLNSHCSQMMILLDFASNNVGQSKTYESRCILQNLDWLFFFFTVFRNLN